MTKAKAPWPAAIIRYTRVVFLNARRHRLKPIAFVVLLLGALSIVARLVDLSVVTSSSYLSQSRHRIRVSVPKVSMTSVTQLSVETQEQLNRLIEQRMRPPYVYKSDTTKKACYAQRDMGIITVVRNSAKTFCANGGWDQSKQAPVSPTRATKVSTFHIKAGVKGATFQNLMLDFVNASIFAPIKTLADDGYHHDPRFTFSMELINCVCDELASYYQNLPGNKERPAEQLWMGRLASLPQNKIPEPLICSDKRPQGTKQSAWDFVKNPTTAPDEHETVIFENPVVLLTRKDDHNPFFQLSNTVNAWIMIKALEWDITRTRVIHLDGGFRMPYDGLQKNMLGPNFEIIDGATLIGKRVHFRGDVLLPPIEKLGPIMECLGIDEPCHDSELVRTFRAESLLALNVTPEVERELGVTRIRPMYVTVITRRPYAGRELQRLWLNEDEVMANMRKDYKDLNVQFRSIDYVNLTLHEQMKTTIESDMIVSMHGAGLVNVIWTRPMTTILEIFPKKRLRYGYRNICQHVGCDWHEFRGGEDVGGGSTPNSKNKRIPYAEWKDYFHPLFQKTYGAFGEQQAVLRGEAS